MNKSKVLKAKFDEKQKIQLRKELKLKNTPSHRWSATEDVLVKLLRCWNPLRNAFLETNHLFRIEEEIFFLLELRSIIHPVRNIQRVAQKTKELATFQVYMLLMHVYFGVLDEKTKLPLYDPSLTFNQ